MSKAWEQLKPKDQFSVIQSQYVSEMDNVVLSMLYQPIVGTEAIGLMNSLIIIEKVSKKNDLIRHSVLLNQLDVGIPTFFEAREKLEAVGLLKTFLKKLDHEHHFIYEIQKPLDPSTFLHDDILSLLLIEKLGFDEVEKISEYFNYDRQGMEDYVEVTKSFIDVFKINESRLSTKESQLNIIKDKVSSISKAEPIKLSSKEFDWTFFNSLIENLHIDQNQIEKDLKKSIELFNQLYGINELEMYDYIKQSIDYVNNRVIEKDFKQLIYKGYHSRKKQEKVSLDTEDNQVGLTETEKDQLRKNTLRLTGFSEEEISVIISCETIPPLIFMKAIKNQKGGFVSNNERWTVENLKKQSGLPDAVINVLIHYMLVVQDKAAINQNMMTSIANDWAQRKIYSPEAALEQVKNLQKEREKPVKKNRNFTKNSNRKETLPDWAKEETVRKNTPLSKEEQDFFANQLKQLTNKDKEGDN